MEKCQGLESIPNTFNTAEIIPDVKIDGGVQVFTNGISYVISSEITDKERISTNKIF